MITVRRNFGPLAKTRIYTKEQMRELGLLVIERVRRRTLSGKDVDEAAFHAYSPEYAKRKRQQVGGSGTVNLQASGAMLRGIVIAEVTDTKVVVGFSS